MSRPDAEREETPGPGVAVRYALRALDAGLNLLQRGRDRLAGPDARDDRRGRATKDAAPAEAGPAPSRPSLLRRLSIALLLLLVGVGSGGWFAYSGLSHQLAAHADVVERMKEEIDALRKEDALSVKLLDKFQRENAQYRHEAREAQRETDQANRRITELEAQIAQAARAEQAARQARQTAATARRVPRTVARPPQKTGDCTAGTVAEMAECIEKFNRP